LWPKQWDPNRSRERRSVYPTEQRVKDAKALEEIKQKKDEMSADKT
jgi:hypothetical protein